VSVMSHEAVVKTPHSSTAEVEVAGFELVLCAVVEGGCVVVKSKQSSTSAPFSGPDTQYGHNSRSLQSFNMKQIPTEPRLGYQVNA